MKTENLTIKLPRNVNEKDFVEQFSLLVDYSRLKQIPEYGVNPYEREKFIKKMINTIKDVFLHSNGIENNDLKITYGYIQGYFGQYFHGQSLIKLNDGLIENFVNLQDQMCYIISTLFHEATHYMQDLKRNDINNIKNSSIDKITLKEVEDLMYGGHFDQFDYEQLQRIFCPYLTNAPQSRDFYKMVANGAYLSRAIETGARDNSREFFETFLDFLYNSPYADDSLKSWISQYKEEYLLTLTNKENDYQKDINVYNEYIEKLNLKDENLIKVLDDFYRGILYDKNDNRIEVDYDTFNNYFMSVLIKKPLKDLMKLLQHCVFMGDRGFAIQIVDAIVVNEEFDKKKENVQKFIMKMLTSNRVSNDAHKLSLSAIENAPDNNGLTDNSYKFYCFFQILSLDQIVEVLRELYSKNQFIFANTIVSNIYDYIYSPQLSKEEKVKLADKVKQLAFNQLKQVYKYDDKMFLSWINSDIFWRRSFNTVCMICNMAGVDCKELKELLEKFVERENAIKDNVQTDDIGYFYKTYGTRYTLTKFSEQLKTENDLQAYLNATNENNINV